MVVDPALTIQIFICGNNMWIVVVEKKNHICILMYATWLAAFKFSLTQKCTASSYYMIDIIMI